LQQIIYGWQKSPSQFFTFINFTRRRDIIENRQRELLYEHSYIKLSKDVIRRVGKEAESDELTFSLSEVKFFFQREKENMSRKFLTKKTTNIKEKDIN
jgi:hypothetical protein